MSANETTALTPQRVRFPRTATLAGWAWLLLGVVQLAGVLALVSDRGDLLKVTGGFGGSGQLTPAIQPGLQFPRTDGEMTAAELWLNIGLVVSAVVGVGFAVVGVRVIFGAASGVTGSGVASVGLGLVWLFASATAAAVVPPSPFITPIVIAVPILGIMSGAMALFAGFSALRGRIRYAGWRRWWKVALRMVEDDADQLPIATRGGRVA